MIILKLIYFMLHILMVPIFGLANALYFVIYLSSALAGELWPNSTHGNCWSYVLKKWWRHGGYIMVRKSDGNSFLKFLPLPHILWVKKIDWSTSECEHFLAKKRYRSNWFPWYAIYFSGHVVKRDTDHNAGSV